MTMRKISADKLNDLFSAINEKYELFMPIDNGRASSFEKWEEGKTLSTSLNTSRSAKDLFFPQSEELMEFKVEGKNIELIDIRVEHTDFVVFGVRACDVRSFDVLDNVFLSDPIDSYYQNRREHGVIMSLACSRPRETCFCGAFGIDASEPCGDVACWMTDSSIFMRANTEKGERLLSAIGSITEDAHEEEIAPEKAQIKERLEKLPLADLSTEGFGAGKTKELFSAPEWAELSESCLGCGSCTYVCPTCQCYDIKDFNTGHGVKRLRCWDSCMYSEFTKMSAGQPRLTQLERFRQRFMHKLVYYPENNDGMFSCVGCGRCLAKCPIGMNIVKVMKKLGGDNNV